MLGRGKGKGRRGTVGEVKRSEERKNARKGRGAETRVTDTEEYKGIEEKQRKSKYMEKNGVGKREEERELDKTWLGMLSKSIQAVINSNKIFISFFSAFKSTINYSQKCAQLGLRIQDGSLCILLRITSEPLQLRTDHRKEGGAGGC